MTTKKKTRVTTKPEELIVPTMLEAFLSAPLPVERVWTLGLEGVCPFRFVFRLNGETLTLRIYDAVTGLQVGPNNGSSYGFTPTQVETISNACKATLEAADGL